MYTYIYTYIYIYAHIIVLYDAGGGPAGAAARGLQ